MARGHDAVLDTLAFTAAEARDLMAEPAGHDPFDDASEDAALG